MEADLRERELLETEEGRDLLIGQMLIDGLSQEEAEQIVGMAATKDRFEAEDDWYDYDFDFRSSLLREIQPLMTALYEELEF